MQTPRLAVVLVIASPCYTYTVQAGTYPDNQLFVINALTCRVRGNIAHVHVQYALHVYVHACAHIHAKAPLHPHRIWLIRSRCPLHTTAMFIKTTGPGRNPSDFLPQETTTSDICMYKNRTSTLSIRSTPWAGEMACAYIHI